MTENQPTWAERQTAVYCFRVWFRFADDPIDTKRATLVDAETAADARRQVLKMYDGIESLYRTEKLD